MDILLFFIFLYAMWQKKDALAIEIIIALETCLFLTTSNIVTFPFHHGMNDVGNVCLFLFLFSLSQRPKSSKKYFLKLKDFLIFFLLVILLQVAYDMLINGTSIVSVIRTSRHWLIMLSFFFFDAIPRETYEKVIKEIGYITIIISILEIIDFAFDLKMFNTYDEKAGYMIESYRRAVIPSNFCLFYFFYLQHSSKMYTKKYRIIGIVSIACIITFSAIRSQILALIVGEIFFLFLYRRRIRLIQLLAYSTFAVFILFMIWKVPSVRDRFETLLSLMHEDAPWDSDNLSFRTTIFLERFKYVCNSVQYIFFGIGNILNSDFKPIFEYGPKDEFGWIIQLDTGDIAWAIIVLRLGLFGSFLYILFSIGILSVSWKYRTTDLGKFFTIFLVLQYIFIAYCSSMYSSGAFWLFPFVVLYALAKEDNSTDTNSFYEGIINEKNNSDNLVVSM